ncbi:MAG TPA: metalloregulator ArsR/SmtB family transcription factor [Solimonas sp.]|nr:metalloregulator ArsR/SmtB family transcription factor [Solimonas sp.]
MKATTAVERLWALAQQSRLAIFRQLVQAGPEGRAAGEIASALRIPAATLSFHLKELSGAGLVRSRQDGRYIYYYPDLVAMNELLGYLTENCCGSGQSCVPCKPAKKS